jgi:hypothetical protein
MKYLINFFNSKKRKIKRLEKKYRKLLDESYKLSTKNRALSDEKSKEANDILNEIEKLKKEND